jgi:hypothetical protein
MKKNIFLLFALAITSTAYAQAKPEDYKMIPGNELTLPAGAKVDFRIILMDEKGFMTAPSDSIIGNWTINGEAHADPSFGKLSTSLNFISATYEAPQQVPARNPVAVAFSFMLPGAGKTKLTLLCNVTITDMYNFFDLKTASTPNSIYRFDDPFAGSMAHAALTMAIEKEGEIIINIQGKAPSAPGDHTVPATMSMIVSVDGAGKGVYEWKLPPENQSVPVTNVVLNYSKMGGVRFSYASVDCLPHPYSNSDRCKGISLKGTTAITKYENPGKVEGYFSGQVVQLTPSGKYAYGNVYGKFSAILQKIPGQ